MYIATRVPDCSKRKILPSGVSIARIEIVLLMPSPDATFWISFQEKVGCYRESWALHSSLEPSGSFSFVTYLLPLAKGKLKLAAAKERKFNFMIFGISNDINKRLQLFLIL